MVLATASVPGPEPARPTPSAILVGATGAAACTDPPRKAPPSDRAAAAIAAAAPAMSSRRRIDVLRVRLVALMRQADVRERREQALVVRVDAVTELVVRLQVAQPERLVQDRAVAAGDRTELDVDNVVSEAPPVREAREVARERSQPVGHRRRRNRRVQPQQV